MKYIVNNLVLSLDQEETLLTKLIANKTCLATKDFSYEIIKKSIDARKGIISFIYSVIVDTNKKVNVDGSSIQHYDLEEEIVIPKSKLKKRPIIVGFGPAGMFSALLLARSGAKPIILERGKCVEDRTIDVELFQKTGQFSASSNLCFGEGGAGTFSDGKLNTRTKDPRIRFVLNEFVLHGAKKDIMYESSPHVGSDYLREVVKNIRKEIILLGGEIFFESTFVDFNSTNNKLVSVIYIDKDGVKKEISTDHCILAIGHSARDTYKLLFNKNVTIEPKPFSVGVRIEHLQMEINKSQYKEHADNKKLGAANYSLSCHLDNGRSVYSFCMCPGGLVMASNTEENSIVTNGMSYQSRNEKNANSALLVGVNVTDYFVDSPLDGIYFQEKLEKAAFSINNPYFAPIQLVGDFLKGNVSACTKSVTPTYLPGTYFADLNKILPEFVSSSLKEGIRIFATKMKAFQEEDAILTGVETRSSSPVRIPRDDFGNSSIVGLYPCGEGASFAGGITSSAIDGLKIALLILSK